MHALQLPSDVEQPNFVDINNSKKQRRTAQLFFTISAGVIGGIEGEGVSMVLKIELRRISDVRLKDL
jgi:hypothetical protein